MTKNAGIIGSMALLILVAIGCVFTACEDGGGGGSATGARPWREDEARFEVAWSESATLVGEDEMGVVLSADPDTGVFALDAAGVQAAGLDVSVGRVLAIVGVALGRVTAVRTDGNVLHVATEEAALTDAIVNGTIEWDYGISFEPDRIAGVVQKNRGRWLRGVDDASTIETKVEIGDIEYEITLAYRGDHAELECTATKERPGLGSAKFTATGRLERFRSVDRIVITDSRVTDFDHQFEGLQGDVTLMLTSAAGGTELAHEADIDLISIPFRVGWLDCSISLGLFSVINAVVPGPEASAFVKATFVYDSNLGLQFNGVDVGSKAELGDYSITEDGDPHAAGASQIGANFGVGFPNLKLAVGIGSQHLLNTTVWARPGFLIGASFTANQSLIPICMKADALLTGAAGMDISVLDFYTPFNADRTFFSETITLVKSGDCPDD